MLDCAYTVMLDIVLPVQYFPLLGREMVRLGTYLSAVRESTSEVPLVLLHVHKDVYSTDTLACQDGLSAAAILQCRSSLSGAWSRHVASGKRL